MASGSRVRLFLPKDTCLITFLLAGKFMLYWVPYSTTVNHELWCALIGVSCPRAPLANPRAGQSFEPEKYGQEALQFTKELVLQREVVTKLLV